MTNENTLAPIPPQQKRVHKILIDPKMIWTGSVAGFSIVVNFILLFGLMLLIPQTHKQHLYQTYEMGYAIGANCEKNPSLCTKPCFDLLKTETGGASCARGVFDGYRSKDDFPI